MSRYKDNRVIRASDWDADEQAVLPGNYGFLELERVKLALNQLQAQPTLVDESQLDANARAAARLILALYKDVTLRKPPHDGGQVYQEGIERPAYAFTEEDMVRQPMETWTWLAEQGIAHVRPLIVVKDADGEDVTPADVTPTAAVEGLTPANF